MTGNEKMLLKFRTSKSDLFTVNGNGAGDDGETS
jgi:hypothetical protein